MCVAPGDDMDVTAGDASLYDMPLGAEFNPALETLSAGRKAAGGRQPRMHRAAE